MREFEED